MSANLSQSIKDWAGIVSVLGFAILLLGGWTELNSRVSVIETEDAHIKEDVKETKEDVDYVRDRVDDIYNILREDR